jgi:hypothetical protein
VRAEAGAIADPELRQASARSRSTPAFSACDEWVGFAASFEEL